MDYREYPAVFWILATDAASLRHIQEVTRLDIFDGATYDLHPDGLFSTRIFGMVGSEVRDVTFGKIDLKVQIFNPKIFRDLMSLRELYKEIIAGKRYATFDEELGDYTPSTEEHGDTGYSFFVRNFPKMKFKRTSSLDRNEKIDFLERYRHRALTRFAVVLPAGLRDIEMGTDGRPVKNELNDDYYRLLSAASLVIPTSDMESSTYDTIRNTLTNIFHDLYSKIEAICDGKTGFWKDKFASRKIMDGTRNVLTAPPTYGEDLDSPNVPSFDSTILGLYQSSSQYAPLVIYWLRDGPLSKIVNAGEAQWPLVNAKTLKLEYVDVDTREIDKWTSEEGLRDVINLQEDVEARHRPIKIGQHYLSLVYRGEGTFKIVDSIDDLPEGYDPKHCTPITLEELIYYCGYSKFSKYFTVVTRYPYESEDSTYPSRVYVKTTSTGDVRRELDDEWKPMEGTEYLAVEFPRLGVTTYQDSMSPHTSRYEALGADNDGDTGNSTGIMTSDSVEEIGDYLDSREAWITPSGKLRARLAYDTSILVLTNLTSGKPHVKPGKPRHTALSLANQLIGDTNA